MIYGQILIPLSFLTGGVSYLTWSWKAVALFLSISSWPELQCSNNNTHSLTREHGWKTGDQKRYIDDKSPALPFNIWSVQGHHGPMVGGGRWLADNKTCVRSWYKTCAANNNGRFWFIASVVNVNFNFRGGMVQFIVTPIVTEVQQLAGSS